MEVYSRYKRPMPAVPPYKPNLVETEMLKKYKSLLQTNAADILFSPLAAEDDELKLLPDTQILTSEFDVLRDDGVGLTGVLGSACTVYYLFDYESR